MVKVPAISVLRLTGGWGVLGDERHRASTSGSNAFGCKHWHCLYRAWLLGHAASRERI